MLGFPRGPSTEGMTDYPFKTVIRMVMTIIKDTESKEEILKKPEALSNKVSKAISCHTNGAELAAALALLPEQTQEEIFRYYFLRQPQRVIGVHIGRTRSTAGRHIQLALKRLRRLMEGKRYE